MIQSDKPSAYSALSYTWGSGPRDTIVLVDGCEFHVTKELNLALRHLRTYHTDKAVQSVWIDAISINQSDSREKNAQIPLMKDIYRSAQEVIVWLGEEDPVLTRDVMDMLESRVQFDESSDAVLVSEMDPITVQQWNNFGTDLMKRPWWRRMWVIQEIVVAREASVMCGSYTVSWKKLETAAVWAMIDDKPVYRHSEEEVAKGDVYFPNVRFKRGYRMRLRAGLPMPILELLQNNVSCSATDPRDMIISLIGLATDIDFEPPPPELVDQLPVRYIYNASLGLKPDFHFVGSNELHGCAVRVDTIDRIGLPFLDRHPPGEVFYQTLLQWRTVALINSEEEDSYIAGGSKIDAYRRTITADQTRYSARVPEGECEFDPMACCDESGFNWFKQLEWGAYSKSFRDDERAVYLRCLTRTFFVTHKGYFGIGPPDIQEDDCVCILSGCSVPVVLRRDKENWSFVGECFVCGIMDGEAVRVEEVERIVMK
ncbi:heterokaryon incompatibility protein-domain-containing protein [Leptodontidium sp. MPI-SDFR-AT-0119]|nr:heterokaryon incompatibility protein-domain-containing protein [Leptodontidium sp. MPI-SDFR-AT-0119]